MSRITTCALVLVVAVGIAVPLGATVPDQPSRMEHSAADPADPVVAPSTVADWSLDAGESAFATVESGPTVVASVPVAAAVGKDAELLDNEVRADVLGFVSAEPGTYVAAVAAALGVHRSTVRYHVRVLERANAVRTETVRGKLRLFAASSENPDLESAIQDEPTRRILATVRSREPVSVSSVAASVEQATSTVSHHLSRLETAGLVTKTRHGQSVLVSVAPAIESSIEVRDGLGP